ncbi:hypothetical protein BD626DRAFT_550913 [Schizophyllum amplum]|uniref:F-box domain-containing protein n=1 Tax=Schizophyllum amplum TaxID=97359 RepID=A0A550BZG8_9AGAR|nr:hypothetical protein BD626DRAFT_550913 [Auriculariopsis ampla]
MATDSRYASASVRNSEQLVESGTYRIPDDVIACILLKLDYVSLWRFCKAFSRAIGVAKTYSILYYRLELVSSAKEDNAAFRHVTTSQKLQAIKAYRRQWGALQWGHKLSLKVSAAAVMGVSGGFMYRYYDAGGTTVLELRELPSPRLDRAPSMTRHLRFRLDGVNLRAFSYDPAQNLAVTCEVMPQMLIRVSLREMPSFSQHSRTPHPFRDFMPGGAVEHISLTTCGALICITARLVTGLPKVLLFNWKTFASSWIKGESPYLIEEKYVVTVYHGRLRLSDISDLLKPRTLREYALPDAWADRELVFAPNVSVARGARPVATALFAAAPTERVAVLCAISADPQHAHTQSWLVIREAVLLSATLHPESRALEPWALWGARCAVKEVPARARGPCVAGNRVVYAVGGRGGDAMLHAIEVPGDVPGAARPSAGWSWVGAAAGPPPVEVERTVVAEPGERQELVSVAATEDNVVLEYDSRSGNKAAAVLTFGVHRDN